MRQTSPLVFIIPIVIIAIVALNVLKPESKRKSQTPPSVIHIETQTLEAEDITIEIQSYGTVEPRIRSELVAQVGGRIDWISDDFRNGGHFNKGDLLVSIEQADYLVDVDIAFADLADAESRLQEQLALAEQAKLDWSRSKRQGKASALALREPQVAAARARTKSANARYKKAKLNLSRTKILAPFDGRVLDKLVDYGQVVSNASRLGHIYASDAVEVVLPVKNQDLSLLNIPGEFQDSTTPTAAPKVIFHSQLGVASSWTGTIIRSSAGVDTNTRQLSLIAQVQDPFKESHNKNISLKIGQYVTAKIQGKTLRNKIQVPNKVIYQGNYVYLYEDGVIQRREIEVLWQNESISVISAGLKDGEILVTTPLGRISSGTPAKIKSTPKVEKTTSPAVNFNGKQSTTNQPSAKTTTRQSAQQQ